MSNSIREELIPIDIHSGKLLDWLIDRRHTSAKWQMSARVIREKINAALEDMPHIPEIADLLSGTQINYFHCRRILDLLKVHDADTKNIFGQYSSKRLNDWLEIMRLYEKEGVYLAEVSSQLIRNVSVEVPVLKKQIARCQQIYRDCQRKEIELASRVKELNEKYISACQQYGLDGKNTRKELLALANTLPTMLDSLATMCEDLASVVHSYELTIAFIAPSLDQLSELRTAPMVKFIIENGNSTVHHWRTGVLTNTVDRKTPEPPVPSSRASGPEPATELDSIDWGDAVLVDKDQDLTGISVASSDSDDVIDWGITVEGSSDTSLALSEIVCVESLDPTVVESSEDYVSTATTCSTTSDDHKTVLDHLPTRNQFISELMELKCFVHQRQVELGRQGDFIGLHAMQSAPIEIQMQSAEALCLMGQSVDRVLNAMQEPKLQNLFLVRNSPRFLDRLVRTLEQNKRAAESHVAKIGTFRQRADEVMTELTRLEPVLHQLIVRTKELRVQISQEISKRYKNRPVNIMGEINTM